MVTGGLSGIGAAVAHRFAQRERHCARDRPDAHLDRGAVPHEPGGVARATGLAHVVDAGADVLVRVNRTSLPLLANITAKTTVLYAFDPAMGFPAANFDATEGFQNRSIRERTVELMRIDCPSWLTQIPLGKLQFLSTTVVFPVAGS